MSITIRPSRHWTRFLKYYILGFLLLLPFLSEFLKGTGNQTIIDFIVFLEESVGWLIPFPTDFIELWSWHLFVLGVLLIAFAEIRIFRVRYIIYEDRVVKIVGLFWQNIKDVSYDHIDSLYTKRAILDRIFGTANLVLETQGKVSMVIQGIADPEYWAEYIMKRAGIGQ